MLKRKLKPRAQKTSEPDAPSLTPVSNGHGGRRAGAGRPPSQLHREVYHLRDKYRITPLDYFLMVLNNLVPEDDGKGMPKKNTRGEIVYVQHTHAQKMEAASHAAPFMHVKLASIAVSTDNGPTKHSFDLTKLSDEELAMFERIAAKAQILSPAEREGEEGEMIDVTPNREEPKS